MRRVSVKRYRIFQDPLQYNCKSLGTDVTRYKNTSSKYKWYNTEQANCLEYVNRYSVWILSISNSRVWEGTKVSDPCNMLTMHALAATSDEACNTLKRKMQLYFTSDNATLEYGEFAFPHLHLWAYKLWHNILNLEQSAMTFMYSEHRTETYKL